MTTRPASPSPTPLPSSLSFAALRPGVSEPGSSPQRADATGLFKLTDVHDASPETDKPMLFIFFEQEQTGLFRTRPGNETARGSPPPARARNSAPQRGAGAPGAAKRRAFVSRLQFLLGFLS